MHKLTFSEFAITILLVLVLAIGASYLLQSWLLQVENETTGKVERAGRIYQ